MTIPRLAFITVAVPFTLMAALWLILDRMLPGSPGTDKGWQFALCGGTFIYGSIFALRGELQLRPFVFIGLILNSIGAVVWVPALSYRSGDFIGYVGVALTALWCQAVYSVYRKESLRHRPADESRQTD